ncbi:MAG TPA: hypothetical protein VLG73_19535 [Shinella sp.]|nr:hypothetical protein [Shinella sp.]
MIKLALLGAGAWYLSKKVRENRAAGRSSFDFGLDRSAASSSSGGVPGTMANSPAAAGV